MSNPYRPGAGRLECSAVDAYHAGEDVNVLAAKLRAERDATLRQCGFDGVVPEPGTIKNLAKDVGKAVKLVETVADYEKARLAVDVLSGSEGRLRYWEGGFYKAKASHLSGHALSRTIELQINHERAKTKPTSADYSTTQLKFSR